MKGLRLRVGDISSLCVQLGGGGRVMDCQAAHEAGSVNLIVSHGVFVLAGMGAAQLNESLIRSWRRETKKKRFEGGHGANTETR